MPTNKRQADLFRSRPTPSRSTIPSQYRRRYPVRIRACKHMWDRGPTEQVIRCCTSNRHSTWAHTMVDSVEGFRSGDTCLQQTRAL